ncbi:uncharacterized protein [Palaemon carinicauda]|uniref:uncharacterized protein n=1 Tax=Palaemon carinicauda TaxID=392227 RepID=UPI0035B68A85
MSHIQRKAFAPIVVLLALAIFTSCSGEHSEEEAHPSRQARQLHRMLDPFGLLGKAGEAVNGAVSGMQNAVEGIGKTFDEGAQHVGKMLEEGASSLDTAFKDHFSQVNEGMAEAGKVAKIVGEDIFESVSSLVTNHLKQLPKKEESSTASSSSLPSSTSVSSLENDVKKREGIVDGVLRMVGIDPSQIGLMALNILIFLAEMITSSLMGESLNEIDGPQNRGNGRSILTWIMTNDPQNQLDAILKGAQDPSLPRHIIEKLVASSGDNTACVQLLVCKMSPVIWGIQGSAREYAQARSMTDLDGQDKGLFQSLYDSLPKLDDFIKFSESCEKQFPLCPLLNLSDLGL